MSWFKPYIKFTCGLIKVYLSLIPISGVYESLFWAAQKFVEVKGGEGWNVPFTRVNGYYTDVYGVLVKGEGEKTFCLSKISSLIKIMSEFASRYFFGIFFCSYHYFL